MLIMKNFALLSLVWDMKKINRLLECEDWDSEATLLTEVANTTSVGLAVFGQFTHALVGAMLCSSKRQTVLLFLFLIKL